MYSRKIIERCLDGFAAKHGWRPEPHTIGEVDDFNYRIKSILDVDQNSINTYYDIRKDAVITANDRKFINRWIQNERYMCFVDAEYFITRYCYIIGVNDEILRFDRLRAAQKIFWEIISEHDDLQVAIEIFVLKCRQLGVSTEVAMIFLHRILFRTHTKAVMASVKQDQSDKLLRMTDVAWERFPFWLVPPKVKTKTSEPQWANGSILSVQSGSRAVGIAQGWTPTCVHISELGDIPNPKKTIEEGLFPACHSTSALFFVMEGTGNGSTGWQAEKWRYYKQNWGNGGRFRPIFIPPACARDIYPLPDWLRKNPIPEGWRPMQETERMRRRAELFIRSTDYLARTMGSSWKMDREYMWFWETKWREAVQSHTEKVFLSQYACTDEEALQGKHDTVFRDDVIEVVTKQREKKYQAYAVTGKTILIGSENQPYEPPNHTIDFDVPRIQIYWKAPDDNQYNWELIPLKDFDDNEDVNCFNKLLVFQPPKENVDYAIAVDTADGLGHPNEDRFSTDVILNRMGAEQSEQVAHFLSNQVNSAQAARIVACLAVWYGKDTKDPRGCKFVIEQIRKPGDECQNQLKIMGFYWHHIPVFYDSKGMPDPSRVHKEGWRTTKWLRSMMLDKLMNAVNDGWLKINSPATLRELKALIRKETAGQSVIDHPPGGHSDCTFSAGMGYFTAHDMENTAQRYVSRYKPVEEKYQEIDLRWATQEIVLD